MGLAGCRGTEINYFLSPHLSQNFKTPTATIYIQAHNFYYPSNQTTNMPINSRILTCSYNRRRARISPQHHDESTQQTNKAQMNPLKSRPETVKKLEVVSENISEWPAIEEEAPTPSLDSEPETNIHPSIFRRRTDDFDHDEQDLDMFTLKRANPVYESDDEEEYMSSASKRQRTAAPSVLHWGDQLSDDEDVGFSVSFLPIR